MEPTPFTEPQPDAPATPAMPLTARLLNVFVTPGEVFEDVRKSPPAIANWLAPTLLMAVIGAICAWFVVSQPAVIQKMLEPSQKKMDQMVESGKMKQADADKAEAMAANLIKFGAPIGPVFGSFVGLFLSALVLWLIARFWLKTKLDFMKAAEVAGLTSLITLLDTIIKTLLILTLNNPMASVSAAMLVPDADRHSTMVMLLTLLNPMTVWLLCAQSIGLAKLTGAPVGRAAAGVFGVTIVLMGILVGLAIALQRIGK